MYLRYYAIIFFMIIGNIIGGIVTADTTNSWLITSGISYMSKLPFYITLLPIFFFSFSLVMVSAYIATRNKLFYYINMISSFVIILFELYYAFHWTLNTSSFFLSLYPSFELLVNSPQIIPLQSSMKCCGFRAFKEFRGDQCVLNSGNQIKHSCYIEMSKKYSLSLSGSGVFLIAHFVSHLFVCMIFHQICALDNKSRGYGMLQQMDFSDSEHT